MANRKDNEFRATFKRDEKGLKRWPCSETLIVDTRSGVVIAGVRCPFCDMCSTIGHVGEHLMAIGRKEYLWMTDTEKKTKVVTAADLYKTVQWTGHGFKIGGKFLPVKEGKEVSNG